MKRVANSIDSHVGARVRMRRVLLDMSQATLAEALGVSFQQVQKYEKGMNKIGAGRLLQISTALNVCPSFFFECLPVTDGFEVPAAEEAPSDEVAVTEFLSSVDGLRLIRAFVLIRDAVAYCVVPGWSIFSGGAGVES